MFWWSHRHSEQTVERSAAAFPSHLSGDVRAVLQVVPKAPHEPMTSHDVEASVQGERVRIPYRVYFGEPSAWARSRLTAQQRLVLAAILTLHHDGFVRERWLRQLCPSAEPWVPPFVVHLLGEYVFEIGLAIEETTLPDLDLYRVFAEANKEYCRLVSARMINYWALYHRGRVSSFADYPAYRAAMHLRVWSGRPPGNRNAR